MKVAIGYKIQNGPWGGGNAFAKSLSEFLQSRNHEVRYNLNDNDIDIILLTDPRGRSPQVTIDAGKILRYLYLVNSKTLVVHRINECDERKGTKRMNKLLKNANYVADHTVFIASWLMDLDVWRRESNYSVILNGANTKIFNSKNYKKWDRKNKLRLVTHHWGGNHLKGLDIFEKIDGLLEQTYWKKRISFTYIGNIPEKKKFKNIKHIKPIAGLKLANELSFHHVYLTASINEPAGMHHIEGSLCGLPLLYRNSGALPEYCNKYGVMFNDGDDFINSLNKMFKNYDLYLKNVKNYSNTSIKMCDEYYSLFKELIVNRDKIIKNRKLTRNLMVVLRNQFPF